MNKLQKTLKNIDAELNKQQPKTMDELIEIVHRTEGAGNYGTSFTIVKYFGYLQGIRVGVTGRSKTHFLPSKTKVYATMQGTEKFERAGWKIENNGN